MLNSGLLECWALCPKVHLDPSSDSGVPGNGFAGYLTLFEHSLGEIEKRYEGFPLCALAHIHARRFEIYIVLAL